MAPRSKPKFPKLCLNCWRVEVAATEDYCSEACREEAIEIAHRTQRIHEIENGMRCNGIEHTLVQLVYDVERLNERVKELEK